MANTVIGLDLGTSSCKAAALSADGEVIASASANHRIETAPDGRALQHPEEVWAGAQRALKELSGLARLEEASGLCLSGAMHSLFPAGEDLEPLAPAVTWADVRAGEQARKLRERTDAYALYLRTGCPLQYLYHPAKLRRWIEEREEFRGAKFMALKDYVLYQMTGTWATDQSLASATGLMDIQRLVWDEEALSLGGVRAGQLPELRSPLDVAGGLSRAAAAACGLQEGLPVVMGASDGGLANLGSGAVLPGQSVVTVGTSGAVRRIASSPQLDESERTWCYALADGRWFHGGASNNAGLAVQWVCERFYPELERSEGYKRLYEDAAETEPGANGLVIVPYFAGERNPHWDAQARAVFDGLTLEHGRKEIARAVLEGAAFCLADIWEALGPVKDRVRLTGMINRQPVWAQIVCDVLGAPMAGLEAADASVIGAGMLGHAALGSTGSLEEIAATARPANAYTPNAERHEVYQGIHRRFQEIYLRRKA